MISMRIEERLANFVKNIDELESIKHTAFCVSCERDGINNYIKSVLESNGVTVGTVKTHNQIFEITDESFKKRTLEIYKGVFDYLEEFVEDSAYFPITDDSTLLVEQINDVIDGLKHRIYMLVRCNAS